MKLFKDVVGSNSPADRVPHEPSGTKASARDDSRAQPADDRKRTVGAPRRAGAASSFDADDVVCVHAATARDREIRSKERKGGRRWGWPTAPDAHVDHRGHFVYEACGIRVQVLGKADTARAVRLVVNRDRRKFVDKLSRGSPLLCSPYGDVAAAATVVVVAGGGGNIIYAQLRYV